MFEIDKKKFGLFIAELLMCEKMTQSSTLETDRVENIVKMAIIYADKNPERAYQVENKWTALYSVSTLTGGIGIFLNYMTERSCLETLTTIVLLSAVFGVYFCCFVKTKLPAFYDENNVNVFYDGMFRLNIPGIKFNNRNWPYIVKTVRICMCLSIVLFPMINLVVGSAAPNIWKTAGNYIFLILFLGGLFIPMYLTGKKYED